MKTRFIFHLLFLLTFTCDAQQLKLKVRKPTASTGSAFAQSIADSTLSLAKREQLIYQEIKQGNVPDFLRKLTKVEVTQIINGKTYTLCFYSLPDYFAIGSNTDWIYLPMTPILAQRVAKLLKCSLPTKKLVDVIYQNAILKLAPSPIAPNSLMTTVPIFIKHQQMVNEQLKNYLLLHNNGALTAGNKKDVVISNLIYGQPSPRVVIYGWHQLNGKPIQPLYNKHHNTWADYSHGIRLIAQNVSINGKYSTFKKVLTDSVWCKLASEEGIIAKPEYPITGYGQ